MQSQYTVFIDYYTQPHKSVKFEIVFRHPILFLK